MSRKLIGIAIAQAIGLSILAYLLPTWQDEEFTLATTLHGVVYAIHRAIAYEHQAPFYFALVAAIRPLSASVFLAREVSVALVVATTLVSASIARSIWPGRDPAIFCALLALNPFMVFAGLEIRLYALALLLQAVLYVCFFRGFYDGSSRNARIGFAICATIAIYTQYFSALNVAGCCLALLVAGRYRAFFACVLASLVPVVAFIPMLGVLREQSVGAMSTQIKGPTGIGGRFLHPVDFVFASSYGPLTTIASIFTKAIKILVPVAVVIAWPKLDRRVLSFLAMFLLVHFAYAFVEFFTHRALATPRHFIALFFPEVIAFFAIVAGARGRRGAFATAAIAIALALSDTIVIASTYRSLSKPGDAHRVGSYLSARAKTKDTIAVFPGDEAPAVARYFAGNATIVGYPLTLQADRYTVDQSFVHTRAQAIARFEALPKSARLWFVEAGGCQPDTDINGCEDVEAIARSRYVIASQSTFDGTVVFELVPRTGAGR